MNNTRFWRLIKGSGQRILYTSLYRGKDYGKIETVLVNDKIFLTVCQLTRLEKFVRILSFKIVS